MDIDKVFHRFMTWEDGLGTRELQCMLMLEVKPNCASPSLAQTDTLCGISQLVRTTVPGFKWQNQDGRSKQGHVHNARVARSKWNGRVVRLHCFGVFLLRLSGTIPEDSEWMEWASMCSPEDTRRITAEQLERLLLFELHPDSLKPWTPRRHKRKRQPGLFEGVSA